MRCVKQISEGHLQVEPGQEITAIASQIHVTYFVTNNINLMKLGSLEFSKRFITCVRDLYSAANYVSRKAKLVTRQVRCYEIVDVCFS